MSYAVGDMVAVKSEPDGPAWSVNHVYRDMHNKPYAYMIECGSMRRWCKPDDLTLVKSGPVDLEDYPA